MSFDREHDASVRAAHTSALSLSIITCGMLFLFSRTPSSALSVAIILSLSSVALLFMALRKFAAGKTHLASELVKKANFPGFASIIILSYDLTLGRTADYAHALVFIFALIVFASVWSLGKKRFSYW